VEGVVGAAVGGWLQGAQILPTYRVVTPAVCALPSSVGRAGIEPCDLGIKSPADLTGSVPLVTRPQPFRGSHVAAKWWTLLVVAALTVLPASRAAPKRPAVAQRAQPSQATFQDSIGDVLPAAKGRRFTFHDSSGEAPASADINTVKVSRDGGLLIFQVVLARKFGPGITVLAYLDTDRNAATGAPAFGAEYAFVLWDPSGRQQAPLPPCKFGGYRTCLHGIWRLRRWNGRSFKDVAFAHGAYISLFGSVLAFEFNSADLGRPKSFNFAVVTKSRSRPTRTLDRAPNPRRAPWSFDSTGEVRASADIATVVVSNDANGQLTFQVVFAAGLPKGSTVVVYIDSDRSARTGAPVFGADYKVVASDVDLTRAGARANTGENFDFIVRRWDGTRFKPIDRYSDGTNNLAFGALPDVLTLTPFFFGGQVRGGLDSADFGRPKSFNFAVATELRGSQPARKLDRAPDSGRAPWSFAMKTAA
jgi:hypothetical protein